MSTFSGLFNTKGLDAAAEQRLRALLSAREGAQRPVRVASAQGAVVGGSDGPLLDVHSAGGTITLVSGAPQMLAVAGDVTTGSVARHVADGFSRGDLSFLASLRGAFAIAAFRESDASGLLAIDRMGRASLSYSVRPDGIAFASSADLLLLSGGALEINPQAILDYLYFQMIPGPATFFRDVLRLEAGEYLRFRGGRVDVGRYWTPEFREHEPVDNEQLGAEFIRLLEQGTRRAWRGTAEGCFLSGGTDSSTVAGMLGRVSGHPVRTFSIGFSARGYDEIEYARIAARHFNTVHAEYYVTPDDVVGAIPIIARAYDQPFGNSSAVPVYYCAKLAKEQGLNVLLAGDGGDELFGGNQRYADQYVFSLYERVPQALRMLMLEPLSQIPGGDKVLPLRKLRSYISQAATPMPARLETYNLFQRFGAENIFERDFLESVDAGHPASLQEKTYHGARASSLINRMLALDWKFTLADNDLRKVSRMCEVAGVEARYPLLDEDLVDFSLRLPADYKLRGRRLRYFFKQALSDFLPRETLTKKKHGFGLPFGLWAREHRPLHDLTYDTLTALKKRRIVRTSFIERLVRGHREEHPSFYGGHIWVLVMLEQWLQAHDISLDLSSPRMTRAA